METFKCPQCGSTDSWFDRSISVWINEDGVTEEEGMHMRCNGCGKTFEEIFDEEN